MSEPVKRRRSVLSFLLKVGLSVLALYIVFRKVDLQELGGILSAGSWGWFPPALFLVALSKVLAAFRLNDFFRAAGLGLSERANLRLYWLGMYYNLFLPGGIGGDGYKVWLLHKRGEAGLKDLVLATLSDRAMGLLALTAIGLAFLPWMAPVLPLQHSWPWWGIPALVAGAWIVLRLVARPFLAVFWKTLGWSALVQGIQVVAVLALLQMTAAPTPWTGYLFLFLVSSLFTALPISYGGAGARELAFLLGASQLGLPEAPAVAVSLLFYLCSLLVSLSGLGFSFRKELLEER
jgi:uncharacterized membrane protein YbhN (UPF0104 family)